ncbi:MBL fold metallo-hydrolase [Methanosphaera sp.]
METSSLLLDFGMSFSKAGDFFIDFGNPRKGNGLGDFIELGLLPDVKGIYREDYLRHNGLDFEEEPAVDGLLLSHAHADHVNYVNFLRNDIPLYMSLNSKIILEVLDATGTGSFTDYYTYRRQYEYYLTNRKTISRKKGDKIEEKRDIRIMEPYVSETIGDLDVQLAPVDHSLPGAAAFLIEDNSERVIYSGDLRFHGRNAQLTHDFVKHAKKFNPTVMLCEGTNMGNTKKPQNFNLKCEEDIEEKAYDLINDYNGLLVVNFPIRDLDRLVTFHNLAKSTDRTLLINLKQAYMLNKIEEENPDGTIYPTLSEPNLGVYIPRRKDGLLSSNTYINFEDEWVKPSDDLYVKEYDKWQKDFLEYDNAYTFEDVSENENEYIIRLDNYSFAELIDIKPTNARYIHSATEPFSTEMELDFEVTMNWLHHFNIDTTESAYHVSGHATGEQLLEMIREIEPDILYPIHTENPDEYDVLRDDGITVIHPVLKS